MRIMIDTNVIVSAILFPNSQLSELVEKVTDKYTLVLCSHIIEELHELFNRKFKGKAKILEKFLHKLSYELFYTPTEINKSKFPAVRDKEDLPIIVSAITADVDLIITGDKDFFEVILDKPEIITPREFLDKY